MIYNLSGHGKIFISKLLVKILWSIRVGTKQKQSFSAKWWFCIENYFLLQRNYFSFRYLVLLPLQRFSKKKKKFAWEISFFQKPMLTALDSHFSVVGSHAFYYLHGICVKLFSLARIPGFILWLFQQSSSGFSKFSFYSEIIKMLRVSQVFQYYQVQII